jgi:hypothetical protein
MCGAGDLLNKRPEEGAGLRIEGVSKMIKEARRTFRRPGPLPGRILHPGSAPIRCTIIDVSSNGARLEVEERQDVPAEFLLAFDEGLTRRRCLIRWRRLGRIGVAFT